MVLVTEALQALTGNLVAQAKNLLAQAHLLTLPVKILDNESSDIRANVILHDLSKKKSIHLGKLLGRSKVLTSCHLV